MVNSKVTIFILILLLGAGGGFLIQTKNILAPLSPVNTNKEKSPLETVSDAKRALQLKAFYPPTITPIPTPAPLQVGTGSLCQSGAPLPSYICGTNLGLFNSQDSFLRSQTVRNFVSQMGVSILRLPGLREEIQPGTTPASLSQSLEHIKNLGIIPLVILRGPGDASALSTNTQIINTVNSIMGKSLVYYEFGNEEDLFAGIDQFEYTASWNAIIPKLQTIVLNGWFGGPVNFEKNPAYVAYFVHNANPKPDFISWHEYTCGHKDQSWQQYDPSSLCISNIANWSTHIADTKSAIQTFGDCVPPVFITEWNYDPGDTTGDPRFTPQFQKDFTQAALSQLVKDGVYAATHYVLNTNPNYNLIHTNDNMLTPEGEAFEQFCQTR